MPKDKFKSGSHYSHTQLPPEITPPKKFKGFVVTADFASTLAENKQLIKHCQPVVDKPFIRVVAEFVFGSDVVILPDEGTIESNLASFKEAYESYKLQPDTLILSQAEYDKLSDQFPETA